MVAVGGINGKAHIFGLENCLGSFDHNGTHFFCIPLIPGSYNERSRCRGDKINGVQIFEYSGPPVIMSPTHPFDQAFATNTRGRRLIATGAAGYHGEMGIAIWSSVSKGRIYSRPCAFFKVVILSVNLVHDG